MLERWAVNARRWAVNARNGGPTRSIYAKKDRNVPSSANQGLSTSEPKHNHAVCTLQVHPPTSPCSALSAHAEPKDIARSENNEAESLVTSYAVIGQESVILIPFAKTSTGDTYVTISSLFNYVYHTFCKWLRATYAHTQAPSCSTATQILKSHVMVNYVYKSS